MRCILFVDDDLPLLEALRLRLRRMNDKWEMTFVDSGAGALAELERRPYEVIVSDMRMPGMDGAELLRKVSERWPHIVRIVLSGYSDLQQTIRLVPLAHQYLCKPCEPLHLENTVERCFELQELLRAPGLRALVGRIRQLPSMPATFAKLQTAMEDENASVHDIAHIVSSDSVIAAKVLQIVNSAFFRLARPMTNVDQAINYLGFNAVRNLAISAEVFTRWSKAQAALVDLEQLQQHVLSVATVTQALTDKGPVADDALLCALLHDIGYWVLIQECPKELGQAISMAIADHIPLHEAEQRVIGSTHAQIGAYLLGIWGLPYPIVEAVAHHHAPQGVRQTGFDALAALAVASALAPVDDAEAFAQGVCPDAKVGPAYLESVAAPFQWSELERRAAKCLASEKALT